MFYRAHPIVLALPIFGGVLLLVIASLLLGGAQTSSLIPSEIMMLSGVVMLLLTLFAFGMIIGSYHGSSLMLTPDELVSTRVMLPFVRKEIRVRYTDIAEMTTKKDSPIDHICNIGDLTIRSSGAADIRIRYLPKVDTIAQEIQEKRI